MKPIFSTISTGKLYLRFAQMPRSPGLVIFVLTTDDRRQTKPTLDDHITPCACARGNYNNSITATQMWCLARFLPPSPISTPAYLVLTAQCGTSIGILLSNTLLHLPPTGKESDYLLYVDCVGRGRLSPVCLRTLHQEID